MTVAQLIALLEECEPDATVRIMSQAEWPFEYAIHGVARREDLVARDQDEPGVINPDPETSATDVFIVEGHQERYGDKSAWAVALSR